MPLIPLAVVAIVAIMAISNNGGGLKFGHDGLALDIAPPKALGEDA
jgi:hypothetical protein